MGLITMEEAARRLVPDAPPSRKAMQRELRKHGLPVNRVAGRDYVEEATIDRLIEKCRVIASPPASSNDGSLT